MKERQREYEIVYLLRPDLNDTEVSNIQERLDDAVDDVGGHVLAFEDWGMRDLAYEVRDDTDGEKFERAVYQYFRYLAPPEHSQVIEDELQFVESMLKYMTVKIDDDLIPEERLQQPAQPDEGERIPYGD